MKNNNDIDIFIGKHEILIKKRYEFLSILNDVFIAVLFLIGSILFLWSSTEKTGIWLFIIASVFFLIRPLLQFIKEIHISKIKS
ncbi:YrhK family protein [Alkalihalobacillus deserti]|uniref:YrhK family protein n=1 Tax=Alkalihalobacillus deserti TaxID=2879466 RepID=UPI001D132F0A|nr:YrhK family protein [Alkalihalobacillus deserti]